MRAPHREFAITEGGFTVEEEPQLERAGFPYDLKIALHHEQPELVGNAIVARDTGWTYVRRLYEPPELYHRGQDRRERINLAAEPACAAVEARLRDAVLRWLVDTADVIPFGADRRFPSVDLPAPAAQSQHAARP
jgi:hypothetical protein